MRYLSAMSPDPSPQERQADSLDPARAAAFQVSMGAVPDIVGGSPLPPFFNQLYFWAPRPPAELGRDGHPKVGGLIPDLGPPRRMWAGGRLTFARPSIAGQPAERISTLEAATRKTGRTGPLGFVTLRHEIRQDGALCLTEWQDLVYREDPDPAAPRPAPPEARRDETERCAVGFASTFSFATEISINF